MEVRRVEAQRAELQAGQWPRVVQLASQHAEELQPLAEQRWRRAAQLAVVEVEPSVVRPPRPVAVARRPTLA
jgi:hypothetical protein